MDDGDGAVLMDSDFPEDTLPEKSANVVQVVTWNSFQIFGASLSLCRELPDRVMLYMSHTL